MVDRIVLHVPASDHKIPDSLSCCQLRMGWDNGLLYLKKVQEGLSVSIHIDMFCCQKVTKNGLKLTPHLSPSLEP